MTYHQSLDERELPRLYRQLRAEQDRHSLDTPYERAVKDGMEIAIAIVHIWQAGLK